MDEDRKWLDANDLELRDINHKMTIKQNFVIVQDNFQRLLKWMLGMKRTIQHMYELLDVTNIINKVFEKIRSEKTLIPIQFDLGVGKAQVYTDSGTKISYNIKRVDMYSFEIGNDTNPNWITDRLIVNVKTFDGMIVYPVIKTSQNKIRLYFADGVSTNYMLFFI